MTQKCPLPLMSLVLAVCILGLLGVFVYAAQAQSKEPVKIGVILGITGPNAVAANDCLKAIKLAVTEINRSGGVLGRPIELIVEDAEGRPKAAVEAANKLADVHKVPVAIGGYSSGIALPVGQVLNKKGIVWVTDATTNMLKTVGPYVFDTAGLADQAVALIDFVKADNPKVKRLAGLFMNNPIGQDRSKVSEQRAKELGLEYVHVMLYQVGAKDFRAELEQLIAANADAIVTDIYDNDAAIIQRQLLEMGITDFSKFYSYNLSAFGTLEAKFTEGMKGLSYTTGGLRAEMFKKRYLEMYGQTFTDAWAPPFYDAMWIVANAINMANSLDPKMIRNAMWPAAYHFQGTSGNGDKAFNMYGKQPIDVNEQLVFRGGKSLPYVTPGATSNILVFRYPNEEGIARQFAPSEEEFQKLYPDYR